MTRFGERKVKMTGIVCVYGDIMEGGKTFKCDGKGDFNHLNRESKVELIKDASAIGIFLCS